MNNGSNLSGWVKLHRKYLSSKIIKNPELNQVWTWCLLKAVSEKGNVIMNIGKGKRTVELKPGQFIYGRLKAANELGISPSAFRNRMEKLSKMEVIKILPKTQYSIGYVTKWSIYQSEESPDSIEIDGEAYERCVTWIPKKKTGQVTDRGLGQV